MKRLFWTLSLAAAFTTGCGGSSTPTNNTPAPAGESAAPADSNDGAEAANSSVKHAPPNEVLALFLDSLRRGDESTTAGLLTDKAREEVAKHGLVVQPPGSPQAAYEIGRVEFLDGDKDTAYVESLWTEPSVDGKAEQSEVVWAMRLEEKGWRIGGMAVTIDPAQPPLVLNFEDMADVLQQVADPAASGNIEMTAEAPPQGIVPQGTFQMPPQLATPPAGTEGNPSIQR